MRLLMLVVSLTVVFTAVAPTPVGATIDNPFGKMKDIKLLDGTAAIGIYRCNDFTPKSFLGYWCQGAFDPPYQSWAYVTWNVAPPDAGNPGRLLEVWVADLEWAAQIQNVKDSDKSKWPEGATLLARSKNGIAVGGWYQFRSVKPVFFLFTAERRKKGERDITGSVLVGVSPLHVDDWVSRYFVEGTVTTLPVGAQPVPTQPVVSQSKPVPLDQVIRSEQERLQTPAETPNQPPVQPTYEPLVQPTPSVEYVAKGIRTWAKVAGNVLQVKLVGANGKPYCGDALIHLEASGSPAGAKTVKVQSGRINGKATGGVFDVNVGNYRNVHVESMDFVLYDFHSDVLTMRSK